MRISVILILTILSLACAKDQAKLHPDNVTSRAVFRVIEQCEDSDDIVKCFKVQIAKFLGRALKVQNIKLLDGILITKKSNYSENSGSGSGSTAGQLLWTNNNALDSLSAKSLNQVFNSRLEKFLETHQIQINVPQLLSFGKKNTEEFFEGRRRKDKRFLGPFIAAVLMKAAILKMAYHSIAIVAGKALIVGKIALIISAIIGLKKLVSGEGHEKTTYEIVKHPHVQQSHTYSSSHAGEYEGGHESGGSYHRSMGDDEMIMQDKAYRAHIPKL